MKQFIKFRLVANEFHIYNGDVSRLRLTYCSTYQVLQVTYIITNCDNIISIPLQLNIQEYAYFIPYIASNINYRRRVDEVAIYELYGRFIAEFKKLLWTEKQCICDIHGNLEYRVDGYNIITPIQEVVNQWNHLFNTTLGEDAI